MRKIIFAAVAAAITFAAAPAFATGYGHGHGYGHRHYAPAHRSYHKPTYHRPNYIHTHTYVQPPVTKSYEKREVYFYERVKVKGYCKDAVTTKGSWQWRKTVHCKKGEAAPAEQPEEPAAE